MWMIGSLAIAILTLGGCGGTEPDRELFEVSGTITVDGAPLRDHAVTLRLDNLLDSLAYDLDIIGTHRTDETGRFQITTEVDADQCDRTFVWVEFPDVPYFHQVLRGCGFHVLELDASIDLRLTGTITLDQAPHANGPFFLGVQVEDRTHLALRRAVEGFTNAQGGYSVAGRFDADICDRLWLAVPNSFPPKQVRSCVTKPFNMNTRSN